MANKSMAQFPSRGCPEQRVLSGSAGDTAGLVCLALLPTRAPCLFLAITTPTTSCSQLGSTVTLGPPDRGRGSDKAAWQCSELVARDRPQMVTALGQSGPSGRLGSTGRGSLLTQKGRAGPSCLCTSLPAFWHSRDERNAPLITISFLPESEGGEGEVCPGAVSRS